jgi:hypothetical protein
MYEQKQFAKKGLKHIGENAEEFLKNKAFLHVQSWGGIVLKMIVQRCIPRPIYSYLLIYNKFILMPNVLFLT